VREFQSALGDFEKVSNPSPGKPNGK